MYFVRVSPIFAILFLMTQSFAELGLNEQILAGVEALGFTEPTPVQAQAIPAILEGRDVVASAQTGTGKTAAFALPVLQNILPLSQAARRELLEQETEEEDAPEPEVLADEVSSETLVVSGDGSKPPLRRRPRRHKSAETNRDGQSAAPQARDASSSDDSKEESAPKKRRRRRRPNKKDSSHSADQTTRQNAEDASLENQTSEKKSQGASVQNRDQERDGQPKRKRNRSRNRNRRKKNTQAPSNDSRASDPNAKPFGPFALVVTPTRELAQQIEKVVTEVSNHTGQRAVIVMGGARFERQIKDLERGCDMLVATPGRLIDLMEHNHVDLSHVSVLVLDEADRMLDMGFWPSVRRIVQALPQERQNLLFSATIPPSIQSTIDAMLKDPVRVEIARVGETAETVEEHLMPVTQGQKVSLLRQVIQTGGAEAGATLERVLVFCRTKLRTDNVSQSLKSAGFSVDVMHADRPQKARERALEKFRQGTCQILVATDVMSRGIDVSGIDAVVNFDVPLDPEDYVHRVGRTGRAGATGHAYTFMAPDEVSPLREIEYFTGKLIEPFDLEGFEYDDNRIIPSPTRSTTKSTRTMFRGSRAGGRGPSAGRYGRHY